MCAWERCRQAGVVAAVRQVYFSQCEPASRDRNSVGERGLGAGDVDQHLLVEEPGDVWWGLHGLGDGAPKLDFAAGFYKEVWSTVDRDLAEHFTFLNFSTDRIYNFEKSSDDTFNIFYS